MIASQSTSREYANQLPVNPPEKVNQSQSLLSPHRKDVIGQPYQHIFIGSQGPQTYYQYIQTQNIQER